jgi:transcriptional regulator with XRE-family HTH domain
MTDIARIETQGRDPGVKIIAKIARGLDVPAGQLFDGIRRRAGRFIGLGVALAPTIGVCRDPPSRMPR